MLTQDRYYDVILEEKKFNDISNLEKALYFWVRDFSDRKGIRHAWDNISDEEQYEFLNRIYMMHRVPFGRREPEVFSLDDSRVLLDDLSNMGSINQEVSIIDDDIVQEILQEWMDIFNRELAPKQ